DRALVRSGEGLAVLEGVSTGTPERWEVPLPDGYRTARFLDDGATVVVLGKTGDVRYWDVVTRTARERIRSGIVPPDTYDFRSRLSPSGDRVGWMNRTGPGTYELELRDIRTGAVIPHGVGPIVHPGGVELELPIDPGLVVLQAGAGGNEPGPLSVRSLADGAEVAAYPPGSVT